jgi:hypothetical protein
MALPLCSYHTRNREYFQESLFQNYEIQKKQQKWLFNISPSSQIVIAHALYYIVVLWVAWKIVALRLTALLPGLTNRPEFDCAAENLRDPAPWSGSKSTCNRQAVQIRYPRGL